MCIHWNRYLDECIRAGCGWDLTIMHDNFRARVQVGSMDGWVYIAGSEEGKIEGAVYINGPGYGFGDSYVHCHPFELRLDSKLIPIHRRKSVPGGPAKYRERVKGDIKQWQQSTVSIISRLIVGRNKKLIPVVLPLVHFALGKSIWINRGNISQIVFIRQSTGSNSWISR